jgi:hypothetical protein
MDLVKISPHAVERGLGEATIGPCISIRIKCMHQYTIHSSCSRTHPFRGFVKEIRGGGELGEDDANCNDVQEISPDQAKFELGGHVADNARYFRKDANEIAASNLDLHERIELLQESRDCLDPDNGADRTDDLGTDSSTSRSSSPRRMAWQRNVSRMLFKTNFPDANVSDSDDSANKEAADDEKSGPTGGADTGNADGRGQRSSASGADGKGVGARRRRRKTPPPADTNEALDRAAYWPGYTCRSGRLEALREGARGGRVGGVGGWVDGQEGVGSKWRARTRARAQIERYE